MNRQTQPEGHEEIIQKKKTPDNTAGDAVDNAERDSSSRSLKVSLRSQEKSETKGEQIPFGAALQDWSTTTFNKNPFLQFSQGVKKDTVQAPLTR